jgi:hypothetical protein
LVGAWESARTSSPTRQWECASRRLSSLIPRDVSISDDSSVITRVCQ